MYLAIIGDIEDSRRIDISTRGELQETLSGIMDNTNVRAGDRGELVSGFLLTVGDEFQGLLIRNADPLWYARFIQFELGKEHNLRFGVGRGNITTNIQDSAIGIDGPCFHNARDAIVRAKRGDVTCRVEGFGGWDEIINVLMDNFYTQYWDLTEKQRRIYDLRYLHGYDVPDIQDLLKYRAPGYVYKVLAKREVEVMRETEEAISEIFTARVVK